MTKLEEIREAAEALDKAQAYVNKLRRELEAEEKKKQYPLYFKEISTGIVVRFTDKTKGTVVEGIHQIQKKTGFRWSCFLDHNRKDWWEPLPDYKEKTELSANGFYLETDGSIGEYVTSGYHVTRGCSRSTKPLAELASKNMGIRNILEAWVHEIQGHGAGSYYIVLSDGKYSTMLTHSECMGLVKMTEDTGRYLCDRLNDGDISLTVRKNVC